MVKKIYSKEVLEKKQKRNQMILAVVLILVMFGSSFGIVVNSFGEDSKTSDVTYNGFKFLNQNGYWTLDQGNYQFVFKENPKDLKNLSVYVGELNYLSSYSGLPLYLSSENYDVNSEIYINFNQVVQRMQLACFGNDTICEEDLPVKDCSSNFIIVKESTIGSIIQKDGCVFIEGPKEDLVKITDEFLLRIIGVK